MTTATVLLLVPKPIIDGSGGQYDRIGLRNERLNNLSSTARKWLLRFTVRFYITPYHSPVSYGPLVSDAELAVLPWQLMLNSLYCNLMLIFLSSGT